MRILAGNDVYKIVMFDEGIYGLVIKNGYSETSVEIYYVNKNDNNASISFSQAVKAFRMSEAGKNSFVKELVEHFRGWNYNNIYQMLENKNLEGGINAVERITGIKISKDTARCVILTYCIFWDTYGVRYNRGKDVIQAHMVKQMFEIMQNSIR